MGQLYDLRLKIENVIKEKGMDPLQTKGQLSLKAGVLISLVGPNMPDDSVILQRLRQAASEVLGVAV